MPAATFRYPETMAAGAEGRPMWVENQRNSWHGVDFAYHAKLDVGDYYKRYMETFLSVDEGIGRIVDHLERARRAGRHADPLHERQRLPVRRAWADRQALRL